MVIGYSKKPLADELGIKKGFSIITIDPPEDYHEKLGELPKNVIMTARLKAPLDLIHFFVRNKEELETKFPILKQELSHEGAPWIFWSKASSPVETDLNENIIREIGLKNGLVDVRVYAIDEIWSGLKFVHRSKSEGQTKPTEKTE